MTKRAPLIPVVLSLALLIAPPAQAVDVPADAQLVKNAHPTLATGALASARLVELPAGTILRSGEMQITQKDLDAEIRKAPSELWPQLKRNLFFAARYGVQSIPVQIFFDKDGREVFRHVGFFPKDQITAKLAEMGVK